MTDWIPHDGGPCPVDGGSMVQLRFDDETQEFAAGSRPTLASLWRNAWEWNFPTRIIAYRILQGNCDD